MSDLRDTYVRVCVCKREKERAGEREKERAGERERKDGERERYAHQESTTLILAFSNIQMLICAHLCGCIREFMRTRTPGGRSCRRDWKPCRSAEKLAYWR